MVDQYLLFQARFRQEFSEPGSKGERLGVDFGKNTLDLSTIRIRNDDADPTLWRYYLKKLIPFSQTKRNPVTF